MRQLRAVAVFASICGLLGTPACGGPYSGPPERLAKPRTKKRPAGAPSQASSAQAERPCRTNFFAPPPARLRRDARGARDLAQEASSSLRAAEGKSDSDRQRLLLSAIGTLENALKKDPYGPEPTYKMAVAYALAGWQTCALALLERLASLQKYDETESEARRVVQVALRDYAFEAFRDEAKRALGE